LTGISARKLRQAGQNLLGGRARKVAFGSLTLHELSLTQKNPLKAALKYGGLPAVRLSSDPARELLDFIMINQHGEKLPLKLN
jgi:hypothetical protein